MADSKISALPASTVPLAGTEVLPIVQSSTTKQVSVANLTAGQDVAVKTVTATAAATQDGVALAGRAGGTSSYIATITPTTLSASRTVTLPNANTSIPVATQILTFSGPTAARTITLPDANFTAARTDAAQSFTGDQTISTGNLVIGTSGKGITTSGAFSLQLGANGTINKAYLNTSGNFLLGIATDNPAGTAAQLVSQWSGGAKWGVSLDQTVSSAVQYTHINFSTAGVTVGYINANNAITTYNSVSDYRLKTVIGPVSGSGERIDALEPIEYEWKIDGSHTRGFLAHKFQEVYPKSVSGDKDAVDANDKPLYQAMQAGSAEVIADLVAEIKSLRARVATLENK
jgi:hypothetical protein